MSKKFVRRSMSVLLLAVFWLGCLPGVQAESLASISKSWASKAFFLNEFFGQSYAVAVDSGEQFAYVSTGSRLLTVDIHTTPGHVHEWHSTGTLRGIIQQIVVVGNTAYLAAEDAGLVILDITYPFNPREIGAFLTPSDATALKVVGDRAYLATEYDGIYIIDVSDPAHPSQLGARDDGALLYNLRVYGNVLYAMSYDDGLFIYSVGDPAAIPAPEIIAYTGSGGNFFKSLATNGYYAYAGNINGVVAIFNLQSKTYVGEMDTGSTSVEDMFVGGMSLYLALGTNGLCQLVVADPATPTGTCTPQPYGSPAVHRGVASASGRTYLATSDGLTILNPGDADGGLSSILPAPSDAAYANGKIYGTNRFGLTVLDGKTGNLLGKTDVPSGGLERIALVTQDAKTYAVVSSQSDGELSMYDVSDPSAITKIWGPIPLIHHGRPVRMQVIGSTLYVAAQGPNYLYVYDLTDLAAPADLSAGGVALSGYPYDFQIESWLQFLLPPNPPKVHRMAFIAEGSAGAEVIDVTNPASPSKKSIAPPSGRSFLGVATARSNFIIVAPDTIYLSDQFQIYVYDNAAVPSLITSFSTLGYPSSLRVIDGYLVAANGGSGLDYYDLSEPQAPVRVGYADLPGYTNFLVKGDEMQAMVIDFRYGIQIVALVPHSVYLPALTR